ncbi:hypothetical protein [Halobaculum sp. MBLA0143]|uniref:hypothetical protein n=1 Tax=Halobaculum sp. MBLA0143 TaxID=3079933 RepID=UPI0035257866
MPSNGSISRDQSREVRDLTVDLLNRLRQDGDGLTPREVCEWYDPPHVSDSLLRDLLVVMVAHRACPLGMDDGRVSVDESGVDEYRRLLRENCTDPFEQTGEV